MCQWKGSFYLILLSFSCITYLTSFEGPEGASAGHTIFPHGAKSNICFVLHFSPLPGDQRRFHELWVHSVHGWEQSEVQLFQPTAAVFIFSECQSQLDTQTLKELVSCVKCQEIFALKRAEAACPAVMTFTRAILSHIYIETVGTLSCNCLVGESLPLMTNILS